MTWTAFRQQRYVFWAFSLVAAALVGWALVSGSHEETIRAQWLAAPCNGGNGFPTKDFARCMVLLHGSYGSLNGLIAIFAGLLVVLLGVLLGANAVARELERGTVRLVWTQSVTRSHWYVTKVLVGLGSIVIIVVPLSLTFNWWVHASSYGARISPKAFDLSGWMPLMISVLSFAIAVIVGVLLRHAGWTTAVALAVLVLIGIGEQGVRYQLAPHSIVTYSTTTVVKGNTSFGITIGGKVVKGNTSSSITYGGAPANAWVLYNGFDPLGVNTVPTSWSATLAMNAKVQACENASVAGAFPSESHCLHKLGLHNVSIYVPDREFWTLQLREGGLFLLVAFLLLGVGAVILRKRRA
jgi:hypothetical protein